MINHIMKLTQFISLLCLMTLLTVSCLPNTISNLSSASEPTASIDTIASMLSSADSDIRAFAADIAGNYPDDPDKWRLITPLVLALQDDDDRVRTFAAQSIRGLGLYDQRITEILTVWLKEEGHSDDELLQAIQTLGTFQQRASSAIPSLVQIISKKTPDYPSPLYQQIRQSAIETLSSIGDPIAIPYLISIFIALDGPTWLRKSAALSVVKYGTAAACAVPYAITALDAPDPVIQISAAMIINNVTKNDFPDGEITDWGEQDLEKFGKAENSEFLIVLAARMWWQNAGLHEQWPLCINGLDGKPIIP